MSDAEATSRQRAGRVLDGLTVTTIALCAISLFQIFEVAPVERMMGIVQKIFYWHVPAATSMYLGIGASAIGAIGYLWKRDEKWDALTVAGAELALLFAVIVMITGPLWARKAWGTYWTWDPRLTTTLLAGLIYTSVCVLRSVGGAGEAEKRFAAALALLGVPIAIVIHYSVQRWRGQHPTVISANGGGLHPDMYPALYWSFAFFTALTVLLIWMRARAERDRMKLAEIETEAAASGLLEET